jgi:ketosteroid isomerase-like protein
MTQNELGADEMIRSARERFNIAIAEKDLTTIRALLAPAYHIVTGRSAQNHGADEETVRWTEVFHADPTAVYRRTPREITINEDWGLAEELGNWQGSYTADGTLIHASGVYAAKWQRAEDGEWVLQAEVFTTLTCTGSATGCVRPDPIHR